MCELMLPHVARKSAAAAAHSEPPLSLHHLPILSAVAETGSIPPGNAPGQTLWQQRK